MKTMKKLASLTLALILTLALAAPAMAAEVTVTPADNSAEAATETYKAYKIFDATVTDEKKDQAVTDPTGTASTFGSVLYTIEKASPFLATIQANGAFELTEDNDRYIVELAEDKTLDAAALADALVEVTKAAGFGGAVLNSEGNKLNLADGYFLIVGSLGSKAILDTFGKESVEIKTKNEVPTIEKTTPTVEGLKIGDTVSYTVTINAKPGATNYVFHDKMGDGLTFNTDSLTITGLTKDADYTVSEHTGEGAHNGFDVTFTKAYLDNIDEATEIEINYTATINANATVTVDTTTNKAVLDYGDNGHTEETDTTKVEIPLYSFDLVKTTSSNTVLDGANFSLYESKIDETTDEAVIDDTKLIKLTAGKVDPNGAENFDAGKVTISGLSAGTYFLVENTAPEGYNKVAEPIKVELTANNPATMNETDANVYVSGGIQVVNYTGAEMPSTGGIGTTIFYIVGGLLVAGAGVLLVTRKRVSGEEE